MKINANKPEPCSILKPDTNSDSPSEKSNGVRLVSAIHEITHSKEMCGITKRRESNLENFIISSISYELVYKRIVRSISAKLIS